MNKPYTATIEWQRGEQVFSDRRYSRDHVWSFDGGALIAASSSPYVLAPPLSDPQKIDPEEALLASLASCHMMWFLALAVKEGLVVDRYRDHVQGFMEKRDDGEEWVAQIILAPSVWFAGTKPEETIYQQLHQRTHKKCYIGNSLKSTIIINPVMGV